MKEPNYFILGAPKCGTTSMAAYLAKHPYVFMSPDKEPHYFNTDHNNPYRSRSLAQYHELFEGANDDHIAVGEASTNYINSTNAVPNIIRYNPDSKFIVMIRNPVDMAYSLHDYECFGGREHIKDFAQAWRLQEERTAGRWVSRSCPEPKFLIYGEMCRLGSQLQRLYSQVSSEQISVVVFDDLKADPRQEYQRVLDYLGVPDDGRRDFVVYNQAKERRFYLIRVLAESAGNIKKRLGLTKGLGILNVINNKNIRVRKRPPMKLEVRQILVDYFYDDVCLLGDLLERDLVGLWFGQSNGMIKKEG